MFQEKASETDVQAPAVHRSRTGVAASEQRRSEAGRLPVLIVMHSEHSNPGRIGQLLVQKGHALDMRKPRFGCDLPPTLEQYAGVVIFGGPMSANDCDPYIRREIDWIGVALKEEKPFFGVCLGAQMLACHLGHCVGYHPEKHVEIGYFPLRPTVEGADLGPWPSHVYHWHREGFELPGGARLLATGDTFVNQAYAYGRSAFAVQFHPEITYAMVARWSTDHTYREGLIGAQSRADQMNGHVANYVQVGRWLDRLLDRWLELSLAPSP